MVSEKVLRIVFIQTVRFDGDRAIRIQVLEAGGKSGGFAFADLLRRKLNLPLQVGEIDLIIIDDRQITDTCRGEIERRRTAQPARADNDNFRCKQRILS